MVNETAPHFEGIENLKNLPNQAIITITRDSYFEVQSLTSIYYAMDPKPVFTVMAKEDFLSGKLSKKPGYQGGALKDRNQN